MNLFKGMRSASICSGNPDVIRAILAISLMAMLGSVQAGTYTKHDLDVDGVKREYRFYRPSKVSREQPAKTIIAYHGFMSDPNGLRWLTKMDRSADKHGYTIIYPAAIKGSFNAGKGSGTKASDIDEESFIKALLATIPERHNIDPQRLYTMGFSNGAQMSALMLCKFADRVAGVAIVSHSMNIDDCAPTRPVPAVLVQGAKDPYVPFGGGGQHNLTSHKGSVEMLKKFNGVAGDGKIIVDRASIRCREYDNRLRTCVGFNDGHTWPGGVAFKPEQFGKTNSELVANEFIMTFFERHKLATAKKTTKTTKTKERAAQARSEAPQVQPANRQAQSSGNQSEQTAQRLKTSGAPVLAATDRQLSRGELLLRPPDFTEKLSTGNNVKENPMPDHEPNTGDRGKMQRGIYPKVP